MALPNLKTLNPLAGLAAGAAKKISPKPKVSPIVGGAQAATTSIPIQTPQGDISTELQRRIEDIQKSKVGVPNIDVTQGFGQITGVNVGTNPNQMGLNKNVIQAAAQVAAAPQNYTGRKAPDMLLAGTQTPGQIQEQSMVDKGEIVNGLALDLKDGMTVEEAKELYPEFSGQQDVISSLKDDLEAGMPVEKIQELYPELYQGGGQIQNQKPGGEVPLDNIPVLGTLLNPLEKVISGLGAAVEKGAEALANKLKDSALENRIREGAVKIFGEKEVKKYQSLSPEERRTFNTSLSQDALNLGEGVVGSAMTVGAPLITAVMSVANELPVTKPILQKINNVLSYGGEIVNQFPGLKDFRNTLGSEDQKRFDSFVGNAGLGYLLGTRGKTNIIKNPVQFAKDNINPIQVAKNFQENVLGLPGKVKETISPTKTIDIKTANNQKSAIRILNPSSTEVLGKDITAATKGLEYVANTIDPKNIKSYKDLNNHINSSLETVGKELATRIEKIPGLHRDDSVDNGITTLLNEGPYGKGKVLSKSMQADKKKLEGMYDTYNKLGGVSTQDIRELAKIYDKNFKTKMFKEDPNLYDGLRGDLRSFLGDIAEKNGSTSVVEGNKTYSGLIKAKDFVEKEAGKIEVDRARGLTGAGKLKKAIFNRGTGGGAAIGATLGSVIGGPVGGAIGGTLGGLVGGTSKYGSKVTTQMVERELPNLLSKMKKNTTSKGFEVSSLETLKELSNSKNKWISDTLQDSNISVDAKLHLIDKFKDNLLKEGLSEKDIQSLKDNLNPNMKNPKITNQPSAFKTPKIIEKGEGPLKLSSGTKKEIKTLNKQVTEKMSPADLKNLMLQNRQKAAQIRSQKLNQQNPLRNMTGQVKKKK